MRTEHELLVALKKFYLEDKDHSLYGFCHTIQLMKFRSIISEEEWEMLSDIIHNNYPTDWLHLWQQLFTACSFFYKPGWRYPRVLWLNKMIKYHTLKL